MNKTKIQSSLQKIILPEILGSSMCIISAAFICFKFNRLDTVAFQVIGILSILLLVVLPFISLLSIQKLYKPSDITKTYAETLKEFSIQKITFCKLQKLNFFLSHLLLVTIAMLVTKIFVPNGAKLNTSFWIFSISFGYIFLVFFSKWVFKSYNKTIKKAEDLLKELSS